MRRVSATLGFALTVILLGTSACQMPPGKYHSNRKVSQAAESVSISSNEPGYLSQRLNLLNQRQHPSVITTSGSATFIEEPAMSLPGIGQSHVERHYINSISRQLKARTPAYKFEQVSEKKGKKSDDEDEE